MPDKNLPTNCASGRAVFSPKGISDPSKTTKRPNRHFRRRRQDPSHVQLSRKELMRPRSAEFESSFQSKAPSAGIQDGKNHPPHLLRIRQVQAITGLSRSSIYERIRPGSRYYDQHFPRPVYLSTNPNVRGAVGWKAADLYRWVEHCTMTSQSTQHLVGRSR